MHTFTHLHVHPQYSILDGASKIPDLICRAVECGMSSLAITDHGNMFGVKEFHQFAAECKIKPIIGCELYVASKSRFDKTDSDDRSGYHLILLARNEQGYKNLSRLVSLAWIEGFYYKPRIDWELLTRYHEGLIASSACLAGEIPQAILSGNMAKAEELIRRFRDLFGDDFYLELMRHKTGDPETDRGTFAEQEIVNHTLMDLSRKFGVKCIATNDVHFIRKEEAEAHDRLLCINTGKLVSDPARLRYTKQEYLKTMEEMSELFADFPEALSNTADLASKVEFYELNRKPILPVFILPEGFETDYDYLAHLTWKGAEDVYPEITEEIRARIEYELSEIKTTGFEGYFLVVQDFISAARQMGVSVGPGRGSAAGSVVAYCLKITSVDPLKHNLLFERFLNSERVSMPDMDIDFDEDGREKVIRYVVEKYGKDKVAQIVTFGSMAAKMAIRDVARVENLPLSEADRLAKMVPDRPGITLSDAFKEAKELDDARNSPNALISKTLKYASQLEGSVRHTGIHACGVIIGRDPLIEHIPLSTSKDSDLYVTQYEGSQVESVGMLKMDFLGLKTLSIIKDCIENIKLSRGEDLDITKIPLDDAKTYQLFGRGDTTGVFQFESEGMKKHLKELKPGFIDDLIAMNALYRPGPLKYIPKYINRKHKKEEISYYHPIMEEQLRETYGIIVYQEQVMLLARAMAGFSRADADWLRKAMGKKKANILVELKGAFIQGCAANNIDEKIALKVWSDCESFAEYAFNKSHSACYSYISYQMAYLKAHYPAEFMAAVLSRNLSDIKKITFFIDECKKMNLTVLGPDINESQVRFTVNNRGEIRFGLAAIKGLGEAAVDAIISERKEKGGFRNIFDFIKRVNLRAVNKKSIEALAMAGAFDSFEGTHRAQYFHQENSEDNNFIEKLIRFATQLQQAQDAMQQSLFGENEPVHVADPPLPVCEPWSKLQQLKFENQVIGFYMSGHPLDEFADEMNFFCSVKLRQLNENLKPFAGKDIIFGGMVTQAAHRVGKASNKEFGILTLEDYSDSLQLTLFSEAYLKFRHFLTEGRFLLIKARVEKGFRQEGGLEIKVHHMELLSETLDKMTREITLNLSIDELDDAMLAAISKMVKENPGKCGLRFRVADTDENIAVLMQSQKIRVAASGFLKQLKTQLNGLTYKLN